MAVTSLNARSAGAVPLGGRRLLLGLKRLYARPASAVGTTIFAVFLLAALLGPLLTPYGYADQIVADARQAPSARHWFGTDHLGRDVFSRVVAGARDILALAGLGTALSVISGTCFGLLSGYRGGLFDEILMRFFDSLLGMPALFVYTPIVARVVRSVVLSVKVKGFVEAARVQGESPGYILFREILPSTLPALAVEAALRFSYAIFLVASLGFLGVGVQPPNPDWGLMVKEARTYVSQLPWALFFPAGAIAVVVIGVNLMADGLKRVLQATG